MIDCTSVFHPEYTENREEGTGHGHQMPLEEGQNS